MERKGILFCLIGPAGGGKTTLGKELLLSTGDSLVQSVSITSRAIRQGEVAGESYQFVSREEFEKKASENFFLEWENVHGNLYGTPRGNIDRALKGELDVLLVIDIKGALNVKKLFPEATIITAVLPPSFSDLKKRMQGRGALEGAELEARLKTARREYKEISELAGDRSKLDYLVVNAEISTASREIQSILLAERVRLARFEDGSLKKLVSAHDE